MYPLTNEQKFICSYMKFVSCTLPDTDPTPLCHVKKTLKLLGFGANRLPYYIFVRDFNFFLYACSNMLSIIGIFQNPHEIQANILCFKETDANENENNLLD